MFTLMIDRFTTPLFYLAPDDGAADGGAGDAGAGSTQGAGDGEQDNSAGSGGDANANAGAGSPKSLTMTQDEFDSKIEQRLRRAEKKWKEDADAEKAKADMTEAEKAKVEKAEADKRTGEITTKAANKARAAEAKVALASLGVKPERLDRALRLLDLSEIEVDDELEVDAKALKGVVNDLIKEWPELVGSGDGSSNSGSRGGSEFNAAGGSGNKVSVDDFAKMNLRQKQDLFTSDPGTYKRVMEEYRNKRKT